MMRPLATIVRPLALLPMLSLSTIAVTAAQAQDDKDERAQSVVVVVTDSLNRPIPFATVQVDGGVSRVADDSGRTFFSVSRDDSLRLAVRRMGYEPFYGWSLRDAVTGAYPATLAVLPSTIERVTVRDRLNTPLARTSFYDRLQRVQRGAVSAVFITPEELDMRNPSKLSQMINGRASVKILYQGGRPILGGRNGNCGMTVLLDGHKMTMMYEDILNSYERRELDRNIRSGMDPQQAIALFLGQRSSIDDLVSAHSVAAIEIYSSIAAAPAELQRNVGPASGCGLIALWTGTRQ